jgi:hypothetical protein
MVSELFKHSTNKALLLNVPEHLRDVHRAPKRMRVEEQGVTLPYSTYSRATNSLALWGETDEISRGANMAAADFGFDDEDLNCIDLS